MKILFTAPRFHTNQVPIVKGLIEAGHEVRYFVAFEGMIEDHSDLQPLVLKASRETTREKRRLQKKECETTVESIIGGCFIPDMRFLRSVFIEYNPDLVICREKTNLTACVYALCTESDTPCILYDQEPLYPDKNKTREKMPTNASRTISEKVQIKIHRKLSPDLRRVIHYRELYGFPERRITPVKYLVSAKPEQVQMKNGNAYYVPLVYSASCVGGRKPKIQPMYEFYVLQNTVHIKAYLYYWTQ